MRASGIPENLLLFRVGSFIIQMGQTVSIDGADFGGRGPKQGRAHASDYSFHFIIHRI